MDKQVKGSLCMCKNLSEFGYDDMHNRSLLTFLLLIFKQIFINIFTINFIRIFSIKFYSIFLLYVFNKNYAIFGINCCFLCVKIVNEQIYYILKLIMGANCTGCVQNNPRHREHNDYST